MSSIFLSVIFVILLGLELLYFKVADHFNIIDKPNSRSSHSSITIRGGGIVFVFAVFIFFPLNNCQYPYFTTGLFLISLISFLDDVLTLNNKVRLAVHLLSVGLMIVEWDVLYLPWFIYPILIIITIGIINAYNFMDGINGITATYSLISIGTLIYINDTIQFTNPELLAFCGLSIIVFGIFNFRNKAKCFAGDVGSVSIAFVLVFLIGSLITHTNNWAFILLLLVYGLDAIITILFRLIRREHIFEAHRSHFYQYLANEKKISHLFVSGIYAGLQLLVNVLVIKYAYMSAAVISMVSLLCAFAFVLLRWGVEGRAHLLKTKI